MFFGGSTNPGRLRVPLPMASRSAFVGPTIHYSPPVWGHSPHVILTDTWSHHCITTLKARMHCRIMIPSCCNVVYDPSQQNLSGSHHTVTDDLLQRLRFASFVVELRLQWCGYTNTLAKSTPVMKCSFRTQRSLFRHNGSLRLEVRC